jgi:hypothetical protein
MNGLPLGLIAFLITIAIRLAWQHYNTRREETTMHDVRVTIRARSVKMEALTPAGARDVPAESGGVCSSKLFPGE